MAHDREFWREFNRRFDPYRVLTLEEVAALYAARTAPPWSDIVDALNTAPNPENLRIILAGTRGTGKTTEMLRTYSALAEDAGEFLPLYVDIAAALPEDTGTLPTVALIAAAIRQAADDWDAPPLAKGGADPLLGALETFGVSAQAFTHALQFVATVATWMSPEAQATAMATRLAGLSFESIGKIGALARTDLNQPVDDATRAKAEALVAAVQAETERLREACGRVPVLLLDGLDKKPTLSDVDRALEDADLLLSLPCAFVLSGPMQLRRDPRFASNILPGRFRSVTLHNVPVVAGPAGSANPEGIELLLLLFDRRLADAAGRRFRDLLPRDLLEEAARYSSGVIREFLELVTLLGRSVRSRGVARATPDDLDYALRERRLALETTLDDRSWSILSRVLTTGRLEGGEDGEKLLLTNIVACYPNGDVWFRPNELLVRYIQDVLAPPDETTE